MPGTIFVIITPEIPQTREPSHFDSNPSSLGDPSKTPEKIVVRRNHKFSVSIKLQKAHFLKSLFPRLIESH